MAFLYYVNKREQSILGTATKNICVDVPFAIWFDTEWQQTDQSNAPQGD